MADKSKTTILQKKEVQLIETSSPPETCQIGEIGISSSIIRADKLSRIVLQLLSKEDVKQYLETLKSKRQMGRASSIG